MVLAVALCAAVPAAAQDAASQPVTPTVNEPSPTPIRDEAERLAREKWVDGIPDQVQTEGSTFRLNVRAPQAAIQTPSWRDDDPRPTRRPAGGSIYHEEMLRQIVPEQFRASTFDAVNVGVDPAVFVNGIRNAWRDWQARRIRAQISRELDDLERANASTEQ